MYFFDLISDCITNKMKKIPQIIIKNISSAAFIN